MNSNSDLKALWAANNPTPPDLDELLVHVKRYKQNALKKLLLTNVLLAGTSAFIFIIWYNVNPLFLTTKIGIVLVIAAMVLFLLVYNQMAPLFVSMPYGLSNTEYLQHLLRIKNKQHFLQTRALNAYYLLLTAGMWLYFYEFTHNASVFFGLAVYGGTAIWIAFNWFYTRPRSIKKNEEKLNSLIHKFTELMRQLNEAA